MCEFLVKAQDNPGDERQAKTGDVIVCMPDGHQWGSGEALPDFEVVKMPGMTVEQGVLLCAEDRETISERIPKSAQRIPRLRRNLAKSDLDASLLRKRRIQWDGTQFRNKRNAS